MPIQKQPPEVFCKTAVLKNVHGVQRKAPVLKSLFSKVAGLKAFKFV